MLVVIGVVVGVIFGTMAGELTLAFIFAAFGGTIGHLFELSQRGSQSADQRSREMRLEESVERLRQRLWEMDTRLTKLERSRVTDTTAAKSNTAETVPTATPTSTQPTPAANAGDSPQAEPQKPRALFENAAVAPPRQAARPKWMQAIADWAVGGNTIVRVGLFVLFVGLTFLLKFAADRDLLPNELKVGLVATGGVTLLVLGWRLRLARRGFAVSLQGAGVAVLYLATLGAFRVYSLIPPTSAFALLAAIAVLGAVLAMAQNTMALAVMGAGGGFLAPVLVSTGSGDHVTLFGYYLALNIGIVVIAFRRSWRALNALGFYATFLIGLAWGLSSYRQEHFATTEPFLIAFFLLYVTIAVLFARREAPRARDYVDATLVFGTPITAFALQAGITQGMEFALASSAMAGAAFYLVLANVLHRIAHPNYRMLVESFIAMAVVFATLAIPLAFDARVTSAFWAVEGAAILWVGVRQQRIVTRAFGALLQLFSGAAFFVSAPSYSGSMPVVNAVCFGALLIALAGFWTNRRLSTAGDAVLGVERLYAPAAFIWGVGWLLRAGLHEIDVFVPMRVEPAAIVGFLAVVAALFGWMHLRWSWREARWPFFALLPAMVLMLFGASSTNVHPFGGFGWMAWPLALGAHVVLLRYLTRDGQDMWAPTYHVGGYLLLAIIGAWELERVPDFFASGGTAWGNAALVIVPALLVFWAGSARPAFAERWPLSQYGNAYRDVGAPLLVAALGVWSLLVNAGDDGRASPFPYVPVLNPLDAAHVLALFAAISLWRSGRRTGHPPTVLTQGVLPLIAISTFGFVWLNAMLLRTIHHYYEVAYTGDALWNSTLAQTSLSVFWTALALSAMFVATRRALRALWIVGAALMGVVLAKLFFVDLSNVGGVGRIVSFIGVGVLMLVIGYVSPVPPRARDTAS